MSGKPNRQNLWDILVVEDDRAQRQILADFLTNQGYQVTSADNGETALKHFRQKVFDVVLADIKMPRMDGLALLAQIRAINPESRVVLITAFASVDSAVQAMKAGAFDYLTKPVNLEELLIILDRAIQGIALARENQALKEMLRERYHFEGIVSVSPQMEEVLNMVDRMANSSAAVLILGESGTGKELIARMLHMHSPRADGPFLSVNCAAIPETLLESELFGHDKGAFTGAVQTKVGRFELAHTGTLFLDEIGDMALSLQAKLLRVLQEQTFQRLGGTRTITVDVRIIAATNQDLKGMIQAGKFRQDLYYRLNVVEIRLPPLRQRREDIPPLLDHFLRKEADKQGTNPRDFSREAHEALMRYDWPGNVRELENIVERACILSRAALITLEDLPPAIVGSDSATDSFLFNGSESLPEMIGRLERLAIRQALDKADGVQTRAASFLGISERVLRYKMSKHGLS
jgi:DNA-binding NtrC family response regulator